MAEYYAATTPGGLMRLLGTVENPGILIGDDIVTVFAPSDAVFAQLQLEADDFTPAEWYGILMNHIVVGDRHEDSDFTVMGEIQTAAGGTLTVLTKSAETHPDQGILTGIALDSDGDFAGGAEAQIAVLDLLAFKDMTPA